MMIFAGGQLVDCRLGVEIQNEEWEFSKSNLDIII